MISRTLARLCMGFIIVITIASLAKLSLSGEQIKFLVIGFFLAGGLGFIWTRLVGWSNRGARPGQPQTIMLHTDDTPSQITWAAIRATLTLTVVFGIILFVFVVIMSHVLGIDLVRSLKSMIGI